MTHRTRTTIIIVTTVLLLLACCHISSIWLLGSSIFTSRAQEVQCLEQTFAILERYQIRDFRNQDWCRNIAYVGGAFSASSHPSTCNLFPDAPQPFTLQADHDFAAVAQAITQTGLHVSFLDARFTTEGRLTYARFEINKLLPNRLRYVYAPTYGTLGENIPGEMVFTRINTNWFMVEEDWN